jgi:Holliday junction resolvase-like predicted endonuclease
MARGAAVLGRNVRVGRGEIDLLVRFGSKRVAVEVKTRVGSEPREAFSEEKANRVWEAARRLGGVSRVDLIAVRFDAHGAEVRWLPEVS